MKRTFFLLGSVCFAATVACGTGGGSSSGSSSGSSGSSSGSSGSSGGTVSIGAQARSQLAACRGGVSDTAFDDAIEITTDFDQSCHEMVVCGGLAFSLAGAIIELFVRTALGATKPTDLVFDGAGNYKTKPGSVFGTAMDITLLTPKDIVGVKAGEPMPQDLTLVSSYFVGADVKVEGSLSLDVKVKVKYQALGPMFELLGLNGAPGPSEVTLDAKAMKNALGAIKLRAKTHVDDKKGHAAFVYDMTSPETTLLNVFDGGPMGFTLDNVTGARSDIGQTLERNTWTVSYVGGQVGKLDGTIGFAIKGGPMPYKATFDYPKSATPKITFACP